MQSVDVHTCVCSCVFFRLQVLVAMLRAMGFNVRLVMSLQPVPLKLSLAATSKVSLCLLHFSFAVQP